MGKLKRLAYNAMAANSRHDDWATEEFFDYVANRRIDSGKSTATLQGDEDEGIYNMTLLSLPYMGNRSAEAARLLGFKIVYIPKAWPDDEKETVPFSELVKGVRLALTAAYKLTTRPIKSVPYRGYDIGDGTKISCSVPAERLSEEGLKREKEYGRDVLQVLLETAVQLGIEQGRRIKR